MKLTLDQQIKLALKLLAPAKDALAYCVEEIKFAIDTVEVMTTTAEASKAMVSKDTKNKLRAHRDALRKLQTTQQALTDEFGYPFFDIGSKEHIKIDLEKYIDGVERWRAKPAGPPKRAEHKKRLAAEHARWLLWHFGHRVSATRGGPWCKLAAILYGDPSENLYHHCAEFSGKASRWPLARAGAKSEEL